MRTEMDVLVMEGVVILKEEQEPLEDLGDGRSPMGSAEPRLANDWLDLEPEKSLDSGRRRVALRTFGFVMAGATALLSGYFLWRGHAGASWIAAISGVFLFTALHAPRRLEPVERVWLAVGEALGTVVTRLVLTLAYYVVITPIGLAFRTFSRDTFGKRPDVTLTTYWVPVEPEGPASRPDKPF